MKICEIKNGNMNKIYLAEIENRKYIIRTSNFSNKFECQILNLLKRYNYNCPQIITNFELNGKYVMLYEYLEGDNPDVFNEQFLLSLAELIKKLHMINANYLHEDYIDNEESIDKLRTYYEKATTSRYLENNKNFIRKLYGEISNIDFACFDKCIVHSDIKRENLIQNGEKLFLIDFGNCYLGSRLIDVIRVIMWFFIKNDNYDYSQIKFFINNYFDNNNSLTKIEEEKVDLLIKYCIVYNLLKDISLNQDHVLPDEYIERNTLKWLKILKEEEKILKIGEMFKNA